MISTSEIKISYLIRRDEAEKAVQSIHEHFGLKGLLEIEEIESAEASV